MYLTEKDLLSIVGGINLTGTILNYLSALAKTLYGIGQGLGGAIRRIATGNLCGL